MVISSGWTVQQLGSWAVSYSVQVASSNGLTSAPLVDVSALVQRVEQLHMS